DGYSNIKLAEELNARGIQPRYARKWSQSSVQRVLTSRTYCGTMTRLPKLRVTCEVPAILDRETFNRVQETRKDRLRWADRNRKRFYLLSGVAYCAACNSRLSGETGKSGVA